LGLVDAVGGVEQGSSPFDQQSNRHDEVEREHCSAGVGEIIEGYHEITDQYHGKAVLLMLMTLLPLAFHSGH
jgi:hypothetical protein